MVTITPLGGTNQPAAQPQTTTQAMPTTAPVMVMDALPCECEARAAEAYRRYMIIQVLTIVFYLVLVLVLLKMLLS